MSPDSWIHERADWIRAATPALEADGEPSNGRAGERSRVHDFYNMTPRSAARALERIAASREMIQNNTPPVVLQPIAVRPVGLEAELGGGGGSPKSNAPATTPPPKPVQPGVTTPSTPAPPAKSPVQPGVTTPSTTAPPAKSPVQPGVTTPSTPAPPAKSPVQPGVTTPAALEPERDPLLAADGPNRDPLPMPSTVGREAGVPWIEQRDRGVTVQYTILEGNNGDSVDAVVRDGGGNEISRARIVTIDATGRYKRWQNDATGSASYFESGAPEVVGYGQHFAPGTSTSGRPTSEFETSPDLTRVRTVTYGDEGRRQFTDIGSRNAAGSYNNVHIDNYGNTVETTATPDGSGGVNSRFTGMVDSAGNGWRTATDIDGQDWTVTTDSQGRSIMMRTQRADDGVHHFRLDHTGLTEEFRGKPGQWWRSTTSPSGWTTIQLNDSTRIHLDRDGNEIGRNNRPAPPLWEQFGMGAADSAVGMVYGIGALSGITNSINDIGRMFGKNPDLMTREEALQGLGEQVWNVGAAGATALGTTVWELGAASLGNQNWADAFDKTRRAIGNAYNEQSKLVIGTDWSGYSDHSAYTLGQAAFGVGTFLLPSRGLGGAGKAGRGAGGGSRGAGVAAAANRVSDVLARIHHGASALYSDFRTPAAQFTKWPENARKVVVGEVRFWGQVANEVTSTARIAVNRFASHEIAISSGGMAPVRFAMADSTASLGASAGRGRSGSGAASSRRRKPIPPGVNRLPSGRLPANYEHAGKNYPASKLPADLQTKYPKGVDFTPDGFPDFSPYAIHTVRFPAPGFRGNNGSDFTAANQLAGLRRQPRGYTWHHHQDGYTMQLIPMDLHANVRHAGGVAIKKGP
ncbi:HNH endonuclease [Nocardia jiangsuensis]|uniref:HNH endonuclease n=1 Tax=Nocardia jiangsuensis TaxID=1691563 RepID=A0ABV8DS94_9NOCA